MAALFLCCGASRLVDLLEKIGNVSTGTACAVHLRQGSDTIAQAVRTDEMERVMQGQITKYHHGIGFGVIRAADGRKYRFSKSDIYNPNGRLVGLDVDFVVESR